MIPQLVLYPASYRLPVRERWKFIGRESHWGYQYLVWELTHNPAPWNHTGKRWVRFINTSASDTSGAFSCTEEL